MVALRLAAVIFRAGRGGQRVQHRPHQLGALRGQVPVQHPGAPEGGRQPHSPVLERRVLPAPVTAVAVLAVAARGGGGPGVDLPGQLGQVRQAQPRQGRGEQDLIGQLPAVPGQRVRPGAEGPGEGLRDLPGG